MADQLAKQEVSNHIYGPELGRFQNSDQRTKSNSESTEERYFSE